MTRSRNAAFGIADQGLSSLTNFVFVIVVARASTPTEFGQIALALAWCQLALGLSQEAVSQTHLVHGASGLRGSPGALGAAVLLGAAAAVPGVLVLLALGGTWAGYAMVLALPVLLLQDTARFVLVRDGHAARAAISDTAWLLVVVTGVVLGQTASAGAAVTTWLIGAAVATGVALIAGEFYPSLRQAVHWHGSHAAVAWRNGAEFGVLSGASQVAMVFIARIAGMTAVGGLRGASTLFGPINVLIMSLRLVLLPRLSRSLRSPSSLLLKVAAASVAITVAWTAFLLFLPQNWGHALLGSSWSPTREFLPAFGVQYVALAVYMVAFLGLKAADRRRDTLVVRIVFAVATLVLAVVGAVVADAQGAAWGLSIAAVFGAVLCVGLVTRVQRTPVASGAS